MCQDLGYFHVWVYILVNKRMLGEAVKMGMRSCLWVAEMMQFSFGVRVRYEVTGQEHNWFAPYWFSWADHFHPIDFLWWLGCIFLMVRDHFVLFRFIFGLLLLPLVSLCCSSHDCQLLTKCDISRWSFYGLVPKLRRSSRKSLEFGVSLAIWKMFYFA